MRVSDYTEVCDAIGLDRDSTECRVLKDKILAELREGRLPSELQHETLPTWLNVYEVDAKIWLPARSKEEAKDVFIENMPTASFGIENISESGRIKTDLGLEILYTNWNYRI